MRIGGFSLSCRASGLSGKIPRLSSGAGQIFPRFNDANTRAVTRSPGQKNANFQEPKPLGHAVDAANYPEPKHSLYRASPNTHLSKCIQGRERILQLHSGLEVVHSELRNAQRRKPCSGPW